MFICFEGLLKGEKVFGNFQARYDTQTIPPRAVYLQVRERVEAGWSDWRNFSTNVEALTEFPDLTPDHLAGLYHESATKYEARFTKEQESQGEAPEPQGSVKEASALISASPPLPSEDDDAQSAPASSNEFCAAESAPSVAPSPMASPPRAPPASTKKKFQAGLGLRLSYISLAFSLGICRKMGGPCVFP